MLKLLSDRLSKEHGHFSLNISERRLPKFAIKRCHLKTRLIEQAGNVLLAQIVYLGLRISILRLLEQNAGD